MRLELKAIKHHKSLSRETNSFSANLYFDNKKVAECFNEGCGAMTNVDAIKPNSLNGVVEYVKTLPIPNDWKDIISEMSLDVWVDIEVEKDLQKKEMRKYFRKGVCVSESLQSVEFTIFGFGKNNTIPKLLKSDKGRKAIHEVIVKQKSKGNFILNDNIPSDLV